MADDPTDDIAEKTPAPKAKKSKRERRREKRLGIMQNRALILRLLAFALPFRGMIIVGLLVGIIASFLGAFNFLPLIPVLDVMLDHGGQPERIENMRNDIERHRLDAEKPIGSISELDDYVEARSKLLKASFLLEVTEYTHREKENAVFRIVLILIMIQVAKAVLEFISKERMQAAFLQAINRVRMDLYESSMRLDLAYFQSATTGDLIGRLNNDIRQLRVVFGTMISKTVIIPLTLGFNLVVLLLLNYRLTFITFLAIPIVVVPMALLGKKLRQMGKDDETEDVKLIDLISESLQGLTIVKSFGAERHEIKRFRNHSRGIIARQIRRDRLRLLAEPVVEVIGAMAIGAVVAVGAYLILKSSKADMNAPQFIVYLFVLSRFYAPIKGLSSSYVKTQKALASAERVFEIIDREPEIVDDSSLPDAGPVSGSIRFDRVSFRYPGSVELALREFSLELPKGKRIALVGRSGSGKSTAARLLMRLYDPSEGALLLDGTDYRQLRLKSLRRQFAYVAQDTHLFNESVKYNILYGRTDASDEDVIAAAKSANAHDFISSLPDGYDTVIGERGGQLSGGQRQRLAIARAILRKAPVLVLDEATSALDNESEALVQDALERLIEGHTTLVIAHRLSTIRSADEIVVMDRGEVVERGTHGELLQRGGRYAELWTLAESGDTSQLLG